MSQKRQQDINDNNGNEAHLLLVAADELDSIVTGEPPHALGQVLR